MEDGIAVKRQKYKKHCFNWCRSIGE